MAGLTHLKLLTDFFNKIGAKRTPRINEYRTYTTGECPPSTLIAVPAM